MCWKEKESAALSRRVPVYILLALVVATAASGAPKYMRQWGSLGTADGQFLLPVAVAVDSQGDVYVADAYGHRIQKFDGAGNLLLKWGTPGTGPGQLEQPLGIAVAADRVYVADAVSGRIQVFDSAGNFLREWGASADPPGDGEFVWATSVAIAPDGRVFVSDQGELTGLWGHDVQVFDAAGGFSLRWGSMGSGAGEFYHPFGVAFDSAGDVYVADSANYRIQKFDGLGRHLATWGTFGAAEGQFDRPLGLKVDAGDRLYVADGLNDRIQVFDRRGEFLASFGSLGPGQGEFNLPFSVAVDAAGNIYVADTLNFRIQKFGPVFVDVAIDLKPGDFPNSVNPRSGGVLAVAILTTRVADGDATDFDAGDVDPLTLKFGPNGAEIVHAGGHFADVDGDGDLDLLVHFRTQETGIACGDVEATLIGATFDGQGIAGSDSLVTTGCR